MVVRRAGRRRATTGVAAGVIAVSVVAVGAPVAVFLAVGAVSAPDAAGVVAVVARFPDGGPDAGQPASPEPRQTSPRPDWTWRATPPPPRPTSPTPPNPPSDGPPSSPIVSPPDSPSASAPVSPSGRPSTPAPHPVNPAVGGPPANPPAEAPEAPDPDRARDHLPPAAANSYPNPDRMPASPIYASRSVAQSLIIGGLAGFATAAIAMALLGWVRRRL